MHIKCVVIYDKHNFYPVFKPEIYVHISITYAGFQKQVASNP